MTILQGIRECVSQGTQVRYDPAGKFDEYPGISPNLAQVGIVVVAETPYAEGMGDREDLHLSQADSETIQRVRSQCNHLVVILLSGRPMIITDQMPLIDAFVCAWLPGQEGGGIVDVLFGDKRFTGRLSYTWPKSMSQLPFDFDHLPTGENAPLFPYGYGLEA